MKTNSSVLLTSVFTLFVYTVLSFAQTSSLSAAKDTWLTAPRYGYAHMGVGAGFSSATSNTIEEIIDPFEIYPVSLDSHYGFSVGCRNIFQIEYRQNRSTHDFYFSEQEIQGGEIVRQVIETGMELTLQEWLFKINPFFKRSTRGLATFLTYGVGRVNYVDEFAGGFKDGHDAVYGVEVAYITKYLSTGIVLEYRDIDFSRAELEYYDSTDQTFAMGYFLFGLKLNIGFGI